MISCRGSCSFPLWSEKASRRALEKRGGSEDTVTDNESLQGSAAFYISNGGLCTGSLQPASLRATLSLLQQRAGDCP